MNTPGQRPAAALLRLHSAAETAGAALSDLADAVRGSMDRDVAEHPDLAELNVRLDALYEAP